MSDHPNFKFFIDKLRLRCALLFVHTKDVVAEMQNLSFR